MTDGENERGRDGERRLEERRVADQQHVAGTRATSISPHCLHWGKIRAAHRQPHAFSGLR